MEGCERLSWRGVVMLACGVVGFRERVVNVFDDHVRACSIVKVLGFGKECMCQVFG